MIMGIIWIDNGAAAMRSGLAYSRRLWLVAHSLGSVGGVLLRMGQTLGRAAELVAEWQRNW